MDGKTLRSLSKTLFSSRYQAELGAAIADGDGAVWGERLIEGLSSAPSKGTISDELNRLRQLGLLIPDPDAGDFDRRVLLLPRDREGPYWRLCQELRAEASEG